MKRVNTMSSRFGLLSIKQLTLVILIVVIAATNVNALRSQETNSRRLVKKRDVSSQSKDDSGKMKKLYSNKEIVAFDDEEDQQQALAAQSAVLADESPSMSPQKDPSLLSRSQRTDTHVYKKSAPLLRSVDTISDDDIDSLIAELSASAVNKRRARKPAYEILWDYFDEPTNKLDELEAEDEMKANEVGKSMGGLSYGSRRKMMMDDLDVTADMFRAAAAAAAANRRLPSDVNMDNGGDDDDDDDDDAPVNKLEVDEKILAEKEYNNQLKEHAPHKEEKNDQYLTSSQILSMDVVKSDGKSAAASNGHQPSMLKQNGQMTHEVDPNLSSKIDSLKQQNDHLFMFVLAGCILAGVVALVAAGVCWYTVHRNYKANEAEYGVKIGKFNSKSSVKSTSSSSGDRRLAQSAQMYHYQHQKQQMIAMEKANNDMKPDNSDNSEGEAEEGDYTVYECPGLAPTGEMVVKNPLFKEDFSQSLNNINSASTNGTAAAPAVSAATSTTAISPPPPAYSTLTPIAESQLIQLDSTSSEVPMTENQPTTTVDSINEIKNEANK